MYGITVNDDTVKSLKEYLSHFDDDAKIVIIGTDYLERECVIACNFEYQKAQNEVRLLVGLPVNMKGGVK